MVVKRVSNRNTSWANGLRANITHTAFKSNDDKSFPGSRSWGHRGRVVTLLPPTSEAVVQFPAQPQVGKLVVACHWSAVYSTEP